MSRHLAHKTKSEIAAALSNEKTAAINEIIQIIQQLAAKAFSISIGELSQLIGRDPTITAKLISSANTLGLNPSGVSINTISDAIHTVGFERIRNLAISLMLAENAGKGSNTYEQRNVASLCVCSGMLAEELRKQSYGSSEPELLFVCASLRNYGKLLLSTFLVEKYRLARSHALDMPEDEAFTKVFGLTPLALAENVLLNTNLPRSIMNTMRDIPAELLQRAAATAEEEILVLSDISIGICSAIFNERIGPDHFNHAISDVLAKFSKSLPINIEAVHEALIKVEEDISALNRSIGISERDSPASSKLLARLHGTHLPQPPPFARISAQIKPKKTSEMNDAERKTYSDATFAQAVESIEACLQPGAKVKLETVFNEVCKAFTESANLENCLIFVREDYNENNLSARYGLGQLYARVKNRPLVGLDKKDIFSICLARKEDILIQDTKAGKISSVVPDWIHTAGPTSSFIILPVNYEKKLRAIIVGTVSNDRQIDLTESDLKHLRSIRAMISQLYGMIDAQTVTTN